MILFKAFDAIAAGRPARAANPFPRQEGSRPIGHLPGAAESAIVGAMTNAPSMQPPELPGDVDALHALIAAAREAHAALLAERNTIAAERDQLAVRNEKLEHIVAEMRRAMFGRRSEKIDDDQLKLALEALETEHAKTEAQAEKANPARKAAPAKKRRASRDENLDHLPHEEVVVEPESKTCPCCNGALHVIGEDVSKRLDKQPAKLTVIVTKRPKCKRCSHPTFRGGSGSRSRVPGPGHQLADAGGWP